MLAVLAALALLVAACGGGSGTDAEPGAQPSQAEPAPSDPGTAAADEGGSDTGDPSEGDAAENDTADATSDGELNVVVPEVDSDDPWAVTVLHVIDDVQIVAAYDAPNGEIVELYDINPIDDIELEYPLYAQTSFDNPLALLVEEFDATGEWAQVQVPIRPNGTTAWVKTSDFSQQRHNFHITIDISDSMVSVFQGDELIVEQSAVTGSAELPTPVVRTFIDEKVPGADLDPAFGDWILSLSAFSETLGTFGNGGLPKLALHGTDEPELVGQAVSSGSIRVPNDVITLIAETVPVGTIVDIVD